jgi:RNA polymerase sigma-70 factor, ECF subfamily
VEAPLEDCVHEGLSHNENRADAEDVIQDAWVNAFIHLKAFDGRAKFSTWLTRIAINSALMALRRRRSRPEASLESMEIADQAKGVEEQ